MFSCVVCVYHYIVVLCHIAEATERIVYRQYWIWSMMWSIERTVFVISSYQNQKEKCVECVTERLVVSYETRIGYYENSVLETISCRLAFVWFYFLGFEQQKNDTHVMETTLERVCVYVIDTTTLIRKDSKKTIEEKYFRFSFRYCSILLILQMFTFTCSKLWWHWCVGVCVSVFYLLHRFGLPSSCFVWYYWNGSETRFLNTCILSKTPTIFRHSFPRVVVCLFMCRCILHSYTYCHVYRYKSNKDLCILVGFKSFSARNS